MEMLKKIIKSEAYWRSVARLGLLFFIVFSIIEHVGNYRSFDINVLFGDLLKKGGIYRYMFGGMIYGLIVAFIFQRRKIIESRRK